MADTFDAIVFGGGSGLSAAYHAGKAGKNVALIEKGPLGGTCVNRGCIPTKGLIQTAEVLKTIRHAKDFHVELDQASVKPDFAAVMETVRKRRQEGSEGTKKWAESAFTLFQKEAKFTNPKQLQVGAETITGKHVFIAAGARAAIPRVPGLDKVPYLTNKSVLELTERPENLAILGGGYIGVEFGHFFAEMGTQVTMIESQQCLLREDHDVRHLFTQEFSKKVDLRNNTRAVEAAKKNGKIVLTLKPNDSDQTTHVEADQLLVATGRRPNTDRIGLDTTDVKTNDKGWIQVNDHLETTEAGTYAYGDIIGQGMFKHTSSTEGEIAWKNSQGARIPMDYSANPHAIFSDPQIGGVGMTEEEVKDKGIAYKVGKVDYTGVMKGVIIGSPPGFAKALIDTQTDKILGFHMIGPHAADLIAEVYVAMVAGDGKAENILTGIHIHPTMPELVKEAFVQAAPPDPDT